ncbi:3-isopropylmalate dehydratase [Gemmobacter nectariphilus]|uniref:LeuD/DmdB family oxidoreductase small subunit n=1 Tax=Gemmobacter nectariphilus TaxID=220343 RepID=UPI0003FC38C0|nr:3-isopropylmalate dehydratase [Gemmobacter nectariphilus]
MTGKAWVLGANIDTDALAPGKYMHLSLADIAAHCLEDLRPDFAPGVRPGDVLVGGENFGIGSSREQAAAALRELGIKAVIAPSFAGIFYRNAFNLGLPALICADALTIAEGDAVDVDFAAGQIRNLTRSQTLATPPLPPLLVSLIEAGGLLAHLKSQSQPDGATSD